MQQTRQTRSVWPRVWIAPITFDRRTSVALLAPLLLYLLTLAPTVYNLDSAELTTAAATGGLTRATGYPLYLIVGGLWSKIPIGDVGYRMNLLSALAGAATIALADRILRRLQVGPWAALGALGLLTCAPYFWSLALIAEVYTLHTALMAAIILLLLRWADLPTPGRLAALSLLGSLSMGHHLATALLVPGCLCYVLCVAPRRVLSPPALTLMSAAGLLGLSIYLYLPLRAAANPAFNYLGSYDATGVFTPLRLSDPSTLWWLIRGGPFTHEMLGYSPVGLLRETGRFATQLAQSFFVFGVVPGLLGMAALFRRDWRLGLALLLMFLFSAGFYIGYRVIDKNTMFLPTYLIWALWLGYGYQTILSWLDADMAVWGHRIVAGVIVALVIAACLWNWPLASRAGDTSVRQRGEQILAAAAPQALILGWWETTPLVEYLQLVEGRRPDIQAINRFLISDDDLQTLIEREVARRPVYIDSPTAKMVQTMWVERAGPLYRLLPRPSDTAGALEK